ncbi:MAG: cupin domain-containing protein [Methanonatronarchaeia archaeon]|nr:MAG: cupin domain-containing protein [Methanonatronarchaeia archaeon]
MKDLSGLSGKTFKLEKLVEYQENSIVSKNLFDRKNSNLTLFAIDKGQTISEHTTPFKAFVIVLDGKAKIKIGDKELILGEKESTVMPPNVPHALEGIKSFKMLLIMVN